MRRMHLQEMEICCENEVLHHSTSNFIIAPTSLRKCLVLRYAVSLYNRTIYLITSQLQNEINTEQFKSCM